MKSSPPLPVPPPLPVLRSPSTAAAAIASVATAAAFGSHHRLPSPPPLPLSPLHPKVMSSSDTNSDSADSRSHDSFSIRDRLLEEQCRDDSTISSHVTNNLVQIVSVHVPVIISSMLVNRKRTHGGTTDKRRYIRRDREERHEMIVNDYFKGEDSKYTLEKFRWRFRMDVKLFNRILHEISMFDDYFTQKYDATGKPGLGPLQKMMAALRILAYGCPADLLDEYVQIGESTAIECLKHFCDAIIGVLEERYMRKPNKEDIAKLLKEDEKRGFPGMLGNLDCMHWQWKNCPTTWHGTDTNGFKRVPTLILEAVASKDLWIWHAFFGMAGSSNDIN